MIFPPPQLGHLINEIGIRTICATLEQTRVVLVILHQTNIVQLSWCPSVPEGRVPNKKYRLILGILAK